jgi:hypothetical protein
MIGRIILLSLAFVLAIIFAKAAKSTYDEEMDKIEKLYNTKED